MFYLTKVLFPSLINRIYAGRIQEFVCMRGIGLVLSERLIHFIGCKGGFLSISTTDADFSVP